MEVSNVNKFLKSLEEKLWNDEIIGIKEIIKNYR
jgi:hypothetical protein